MNGPYKGKFKVTQIYKGPDHKGMDLVGLDSKDLYATEDMVIEAARRDVDPNDPNNKKYGMGNYVRGKGKKSGLYYYFAHLSRIIVKAGQEVKRGAKVGREGSTGHSTGSHCHYEVRSRPDNTTYLDVSQISGIPNELGTYEQEDAMGEKELTAAEAKTIVKEKAGLDDKTIDYLANDYKYGSALIIKLAKAMA